MTPLKDSVLRELAYQIDGRAVVAGLEMSGGKPVLTLRLKGLKTGWEVDLRAIADFAALHPRPGTGNLELLPSYDGDQARKWRKQYEERRKAITENDISGGMLG